MKASEVQIGAVYLTRIGEELARVVVVSEAHRDPGTKRASGRAGPRRWYVRRIGASSHLPKPRSSSALRPAPDLSEPKGDSVGGWIP